MITATVNEAVRAAQVPMSEEWISEEELLRQFQMFSKSGLKDYGKYLPQAKFTYRDRHGVVHETHVAYGKHAINAMIANNDLDFTRKDRVVYRASKGRRPTSLKSEGTAAEAMR